MHGNTSRVNPRDWPSTNHTLQYSRDKEYEDISLNLNLTTELEPRQLKRCDQRGTCAAGANPQRVYVSVLPEHKLQASRDNRRRNTVIKAVCSILSGHVLASSRCDLARGPVTSQGNVFPEVCHFRSFFLWNLMKKWRPKEKMKMFCLTGIQRWLKKVAYQEASLLRQMQV